MWLIKSEEETDPRYGKSPNERSVEETIKTSVVLVDKNSGPTSHVITSWVKNIFQTKKAGHAGTLDPAVTGVLPVALENAVKAMPVLMGLDKEYVGVMHLHKEISKDLIENGVMGFVGKITQVPPVKSAVARRPREREIKFFDILDIENKDVLFKVGCQAGTYIRKLIHDLGQELKIGAHMTELRRTKAGNFTEEQSHPLVEIKDAYEFWREGNEKYLRKILIPVEFAILHVKRVFVKDSAVSNVANGSPVYPNGICRIQKDIVRGETVGVYSLKEELVALGIAKMSSEEMFKAKRGMAIRTDRVFIDRNIYPNVQK